MAPTFGAIGTRLAGASTNSANLAVPASVVAKSVVFAVVYTDNSSAVTVSPPDVSWTAATGSPVSNGADLRVWVFWKRATGSDSGTYNFTLSTTVNWRNGWATRIDGCIETGSPVDVSTTAAATGSLSYPNTSLTTTGPNELLLWLAASYDGARLSAAPTGLTIRGQGVNDNSDAGLAVCTGAKAVAGATGTISATANDGTNEKMLWFGALKPVATSAPVIANRGLTVATRRAGFY